MSSPGNGAKIALLRFILSGVIISALVELIQAQRLPEKFKACQTSDTANLCTSSYTLPEGFTMKNQITKLTTDRSQDSWVKLGKVAATVRECTTDKYYLLRVDPYKSQAYIPDNGTSEQIISFSPSDMYRKSIVGKNLLF
jgi:hypothetical protein